MNMTIYINKRNTELLAHEPNKGGLINKLLAEHYAGNGPLIPEKRNGPTLYVTKEAKKYIDEIGEYQYPKKNIDLPDGKKTIQFDSTPVGPNAFHKLTTDKVSSNIRPDIKQCPHGYAIGMCKKADCNRKYKK